jgi:hypothetical protein
MPADNHDPRLACLLAGHELETRTFDLVVSDPDSASARLPRTGASTSPVAGGSTDASRATAAGPTVDISTTVSDALAPAAIPSGPAVTARRAAGSATIVISNSAWLAASAGVAAGVAPSSASGPAFAADLVQTITPWPAASSRAAMRLPIAPSPTTATAVMCSRWSFQPRQPLGLS